MAFEGHVVSMESERVLGAHVTGLEQIIKPKL